MSNIPIIWPMKCKAIKSQSELERLIHSGQYVIEEKIKGVRGVIHINDGKVRVFSRGSSKYNPDQPIELTHRLPHFEVPSTMPDMILDCELFAHGLDDAEIAGKVNWKSDLPTDERIQAFVFDMLKYKDMCALDISYQNRLLNLDTQFHNRLYDLPWINRPYQGKDLNFIDSILDQGGEGVVLKNIHSDYVITEKNFKRAGYWYKFKRKDTVDAVIIGSKMPEKYYTDRESGVQDKSRLTKFYEKGWIGSIEFEFAFDCGKGFSETRTGYCSGMTDDLRAELSDPNNRHCVKAEYLGQLIEVEFFEMNQYGNLEHPRLKRVRFDLEK